jgi:hypothetical protein
MGLFLPGQIPEDSIPVQSLDGIVFTGTPLTTPYPLPVDSA